MRQQIRTGFALMLGLALLASCATVGNGTIPDAEVLGWVEETVAQRQPAPEDRRFDEIAWASDIRNAIQLARAHNRPIFLMTGDGRINTGRC
jgi:hypothetical protein